jgi:peptidoglycan/LPS O-acetylase OafA/YrhL
MMRYAKFLLAIVATVVSGIVAAMTDGQVTPGEWINVAIAGVGAAAVWAAPNVPGARYTKAILAVLTAVLTFLASAITDGLNSAELLQIVVIALGAVGVYAVPNSPPSRTP